MKNSITEKSIVVASEKQISSDLNDETAILNFEKGFYYGLNDVGRDVWKLLQKPVSIDEVFAQLLSDYEIDKDTLRTDLFELLQQLESRGLIEVIS